MTLWVFFLMMFFFSIASGRGGVKDLCSLMMKLVGKKRGTFIEEQ